MDVNNCPYCDKPLNYTFKWWFYDNGIEIKRYVSLCCKKLQLKDIERKR